MYGRGMAAILSLDDGRKFLASNMGISGAFFLMSRQLPDNPSLARWLFDKSEQCAPFFDIDTRAFSDSDRVDFWRAAKRAQAELLESFEPVFFEQTYSASEDCLKRLVVERLRIDADEPATEGYREPLEPFQQIDVNDTWQSAPALDAAMLEAEAALLEWRRSEKAKRCSVE